METREVSPLREPSWDEWVLRHRNYHVFHGSPWIRVLHEAYGYEPRCMVYGASVDLPSLFPLVEVDSMITGKRAVCLPFSDHCAPLVATPDAFEALLEASCRLGRKRGWRYVEWRERAMPADETPPRGDWVSHHLKLQPSDAEQWSGLRASNRTSIRKAEKSGVEVLRLADLESVTSYYRLHCRTRRRFGLPPQPFRFFRKIHEHILEPGKGFVSLARWEGRWIAGAVFFHFGTRALFKFGASDLAFGHLRPNNLLMWDAIRHFRKGGFSSFSFGRTSPRHQGLLQYKRGWGAEERMLNYYRIDLKGSVRPTRGDPDSPGSAVKGTLRRMPLFVLRLLGELGYRHLG